MKADPQHMHDKLGLFTLCGSLVIVLFAVVAGVFLVKEIPPAGVGLLGTIVGGVISSFNNIVKLIQVSWESAGWNKMTDALAASGPAADPDHPQQVKVVNTEPQAVTVIPDPGASPQEVKVVNPSDEPVPTVTTEETPGDKP